MKMGAEIRVMQPRAQEAWGPQKLEEAGRTLPWSLGTERGPGTSGLRTSGPGLREDKFPLL